MRTQTLTKQMYTASLDRDRDFHFRVKDPGSAATHFIGFLAAVLMTAGVVSTCSRQWCGSYDDDRYECFYDQHDSSLWCKYILSFIRHFRKGESAFEETGSYDDFCIDCRFLYSGLSDCIKGEHWYEIAGYRLGAGDCGDDF